MTDPNNKKDFFEKINKAIKYPNGDEAKEILLDVLPILTSCGSQTIFGGFERAKAITEIVAMCRWHGPLMIFLTLILDDVNTPTAIRLCYKSYDNKNFPATINESFLNELKKVFLYLRMNLISLLINY